MKEFDFIKRYLQTGTDKDVVLGIGDDAAIVRPREGFDLCFSADMLLKDRHFFSDVKPEGLAWKVLAVNISDMAAMGAIPRWVLLSAALPELDEVWLERFCGSFFGLAKKFGVTLIGGDTTKGDMAFNVTIIGELPKGRALRRDAAVAGDDIWVSGRVGMAAAALNCRLKRCVLPDDVFAECEQKLLHPEPRVGLGLALLPFARAAQDVSDGLAQDLGHILTASGVGAEIWADSLPSLSVLKDILPRAQWLSYTLAGGDDYELVFTAPESCRSRVLDAAERCGVPVTCIGKINGGCRLKVLDAGGRELELHSLGFDHFG
ncbi:TPA: thiamine-phosphate kinase [Neisseria gonorrhoeae]